VRILVVAATAAEVAPLVSRLRADGPAPTFARRATAGEEAGPPVRQYTVGHHDIDILVTGVGMVATAAWTSRELARERYNAAFNFGVCGSFNRAFAPGTVVHVVTDRLAELGAEDGDTFLTIQQMRLLDDDEFPFEGGRLVNVSPPQHGALRSLSAVHGITVNTVHGNERSIASVVERFTPDVESMEGAGFMYACLIHGVPFAQVRAVSNIVERRNRDAWQLDLAMSRLGEVAWDLLEA
jgi:futalosine hydrolase